MDRFGLLAEDLSNAEFLADDPMHAEEYNPPHRPAGFSPYDAVVPLKGDDWDEQSVTKVLHDHEALFEEVVGVGPNDDPRIEADKLAYVSLVSYAP